MFVKSGNLNFDAHFIVFCSSRDIWPVKEIFMDGTIHKFPARGDGEIIKRLTSIFGHYMANYCKENENSF